MADRELVYRISVAGQSEAKAAIRSIVQEANRAANEEAKATRAMVDTVIRERKRGAAGVRQAVDAEAQHEERMQKFLQRAAAQAFQQKAREAQKSERERERAAQRAGEAIVKAMNAEVRAFTKAEKEKTKAAEREVRERQKFVERAEANTSRFMMQERRRSASQSERDARQFARDRAFEERRLLKGIATGMSEGIGSGMRYSYGLAARGVREVAGGMGMNRGWDLSDIATERAAISRTMRSVAIEARTAGGGFSFDEAGAKAKLANVARSSGYTQTELAGAIDAYSEKGSGASGVRDLDKIAMQARAMGADPATVARLRANLEMKGMDSAGIDQFMARMHFVGKTGVFRASDMAQQSEMMLASFGPDIAKGGNQFLAFANEVRKSTGSGAMARTAFDSALDTLDKKRDKIQALGVKYEDEHGDRSKVDIIQDIIAATGGDKSKLAKIFDPSRSGKAITTMVDAFRGAGGGDAGRAAMQSLLAGDASLKNASLGEMQKDADAATSEASTKLAIKMEELRQKLAEKLLPVIDKLVDKFLKIIESKAFSKGIDFVADNPLKSMAMAGLAAGFGPKLLQIVGSSAARFGAGMLVNTVPGARGVGGRAASGVMGGIAGALSSAGAQPVFVTNWPNGGVGGGGDGLPGIGGIGGLGGGAASAEGALGAIGGAGGAAAIGTAIAAAVGIAATAAIGVAVLENHDTAWMPKVGRKGTQADRDELDAARSEKKRQTEGILDIASNGGNFVETDAGRDARIGKAKAREKVRNDRWLYEFLDKGYLGKTQGYSSPVTAEIAGGDGSRKNVANTPAGRLSGQGEDARAMENFRTTLNSVSRDLENFGRKAKSAQPGFSVLKADPSLDR